MPLNIRAINPQLSLGVAISNVKNTDAIATNITAQKLRWKLSNWEPILSANLLEEYINNTIKTNPKRLIENPYKFPENELS